MSPKRLPVVSGARVVRALEKDGFGVIGTKGSHCKLRRGSRTVIVPLHNEVRAGTLASILRAADMTADRLCELLRRIAPAWKAAPITSLRRRYPGQRVWRLPASDRQFAGFTVRSGTQRARHLIRNGSAAGSVDTGCD